MTAGGRLKDKKDVDPVTGQQKSSAQGGPASRKSGVKAFLKQKTGLVDLVPEMPDLPGDTGVKDDGNDANLQTGDNLDQNAAGNFNDPTLIMSPKSDGFLQDIGEEDENAHMGS